MSDELKLGDQVAWVFKNNQRHTTGISSIHRVFENGKTFCNHVIPDEPLRFPPLASLHVCSRCAKLSARAIEFSQRRSA